MSSRQKELAPAIRGITGLPLHLLGWKAFQDLAVAVAEECLRRPVQSFLPTNDAGRDGAFIGRWEGDDPAAGESTIQCKFTSRPGANLVLSMLKEEIAKAGALAARRLATDYIILTNHPVTGASELQIRAAFEQAGVRRCRVFGYDWILRQIRASPRLRMLAPRVYGLGDLSDLLDARAYAQAQLILSTMGDDLQRLVVTDAHRRSVRAISAHNLVLLLGAPAAGKSTIGASLAIGAADIWQSGTIRATSPHDIQRHVNPGEPQFFWIDDAWGTTQYQRQSVEEWNRVFPLMQGAMKSGARFLITSRDYIWHAARKDLKLQALPILGKSQVVIDVHELSTQEKAQILYNHLKLGDQPHEFRRVVKPHLPAVAECKDFLPETARRFGSRFFLASTPTLRQSVLRFFEHPEGFLQETIANLAADCRAAVAVVFMAGGKVRSPVAPADLRAASDSFGVPASQIRDQLEALNGSLLLLAQDDHGSYWTYKHPTVSDAFARYLANSPELVDIYLRGANPTSIVREVVCAGCPVPGASVVVPDTLHGLLADRLSSLDDLAVRTFLSYRANPAFSKLMLGRRPALIEDLYFMHPLREDSDADLIATLHEQGLLPEPVRAGFVEAVREGAVTRADASFLDDPRLGAVLTKDETRAILHQVAKQVLRRLPAHVERLRSAWDKMVPPEDHFEEFARSAKLFADALAWKADYRPALRHAEKSIAFALAEMSESYEPPSSTAAPTAASTPSSANLTNLFRDVDE
jgi:hypothetical protein